MQRVAPCGVNDAALPPLLLTLPRPRCACTRNVPTRLLPPLQRYVVEQNVTYTVYWDGQALTLRPSDPMDASV
jgi:hypothetical protein